MASVAVVGAGGVGGLLAARLARAGHDVRLLARGAAAAAIAARGLTLRGPDGDFTTPIARVSDEAAALGEVELVLVAVKTWQVRQVAARLSPLVGPATTVAPLQNGVEAADALASALPPARVVGGLCHMLSQAERPGELRWMGAPPSVTLGPRRPEQQAAVDAAAGILRSAGLKVQVTGDIEAALWAKLLFIAPFGAVGAAERVTAGPLRTEPRTRARLEAAMHEAAAVAAARAVTLPADAVATAMRRIDALPDDATASLQRDILAGRPSELHELIGAVARLGAAAGVATPVSAGLYATLEPLEARARTASQKRVE